MTNLKTKVLAALAAFMLFVVFGAGAAEASVKKTEEYLGQLRSANSTSYCGAQRDAVGGWVYFGVVAMNRHPIGTRIRLVGTSFFGRKDFIVKDRYGWGTELDFFSPDCNYTWNVWGRRQVRYRIVYTRVVKLTPKQICARRTTKESKNRCLKEQGISKNRKK